MTWTQNKRRLAELTCELQDVIDDFTSTEPTRGSAAIALNAITLNLADLFDAFVRDHMKRGAIGVSEFRRVFENLIRLQLDGVERGLGSPRKVWWREMTARDRRPRFRDAG